MCMQNYYVCAKLVCVCKIRVYFLHALHRTCRIRSWIDSVRSVAKVCVGLVTWYMGMPDTLTLSVCIMGSIMFVTGLHRQRCWWVFQLFVLSVSIILPIHSRYDCCSICKRRIFSLISIRHLELSAQRSILSLVLIAVRCLSLYVMFIFTESSASTLETKKLKKPKNLITNKETKNQKPIVEETEEL